MQKNCEATGLLRYFGSVKPRGHRYTRPHQRGCSFVLVRQYHYYVSMICGFSTSENIYSDSDYKIYVNRDGLQLGVAGTVPNASAPWTHWCSQVFKLK